MAKDEYGNEGDKIYKVTVTRRQTTVYTTELEIAADSEDQACLLAEEQTETWDNDCFDEDEVTCDTETEITDSWDDYDPGLDNEDEEEERSYDPYGDIPKSRSAVPRPVEMPIDR